MTHSTSTLNDLAAVEQSIADAETQLTADQARLERTSVLDPTHATLFTRIRVQQATIAALNARHKTYFEQGPSR